MKSTKYTSRPKLLMLSDRECIEMIEGAEKIAKYLRKEPDLPKRMKKKVEFWLALAKPLKALAKLRITMLAPLVNCPPAIEN